MCNIHKKFIIFIIFTDNPFADQPCHRFRLHICHAKRSQPVIRLVKHAPRDQILDKFCTLGRLHIICLDVLQKGIQLANHVIVIIKPKQLRPDFLLKALHHLRRFRKILKAFYIVLRYGNVILVHFTQINVKAQPSLHITADICHLSLWVHQLFIFIMNALCKTVSMLVL